MIPKNHFETAPYFLHIMQSKLVGGRFTGNSRFTAQGGVATLTEQSDAAFFDGE